MHYFYRCAFLVIIGLLIGCSNNPIRGNLEPNAAISLCMSKLPPPPPRNKYLIDGHLYTTLSVSFFAGYEDERSLTLSYFSQYPDLDTDYEAVPVAIKYFFLPHRWKWRNDITSKLHSLHGGNRKAIDARRIELRKKLALALINSKNDWLSGLLIHAYGDAFAHTKNKLNAENEKAYGKWIGHALPTIFRRSPDEIKGSRINEEKYLAYASDLYRTIKLGNSDDIGFADFLSFVDELECNKGVCPNFHVLYHENSELKDTRIDIYTDCMNKNMRQLSVTEIQGTMDLLSDINN